MSDLVKCWVCGKLRHERFCHETTIFLGFKAPTCQDCASLHGVANEQEWVEGLRNYDKCPREEGTNDW